jgi:hypothetical protein
MLFSNLRQYAMKIRPGRLEIGNYFPERLNEHFAKAGQKREDASKRTIILEPFGGLANRMRVIASGIWLKNEINADLEVAWIATEEINCPYKLIFETNEAFRLVPKKKYNKYVRSTNQANLIKRITASAINKLIGIDYCIKEDDFDGLIWAGKLDIVEVARKNKSIYFQTCEEFGDNLSAFKCFQPVAHIREQVNLVAKTFTEHTVGVHIRRSDHRASIKNSPLELFIEKMQHELSTNKDKSFFLSTDDPEVEKVLFNVFGQKIITHKKEFSRQTVKGIQDAAVDLYCLSKTNKVIGSYWSSFSDVASRINQIPLEIIKK